jgi:glycosyltransferase involved in cell wall biosynthesis
VFEILTVMFFLAVLFALWFFFGKIFQVRIIVPDNSLGLKLDAELYAKLLPGSRILHINWKSPRRHLDYFRFAKANIYMQRSAIGRGFPALKNYLVPNPEFFEVTGKLPDEFLCKTRHAVQALSKLAPTVYVGHTSFDYGNYSRNKDENLIVLFAGKSWLKNADKVLQAWLRNLDFPHLVMTYQNALPADVDKNNLPVNLSIYESLSEADMNHYARQAGAFLCPSSIEGFGHYINEGRASGALVLTTDYSPMNELIDEDSGILIAPESAIDAAVLVNRPHLVSDYDFELKAAIISVENIEQAVRAYMTMPQEEKQRRRDNARSRYLAERDGWEKNLSQLFL